MSKDNDVLIVGAGIAGLTCARQLFKHDVPSLVLEATDRTGGRVKTDERNGFLLDHGFQIFLTSYPEAARTLDYDALQLCKFEPGALIRHAGRFRRLVDPWRRPRHALATALSPVATFADKLRIAAYRRDTSRHSLDDLVLRPERDTLSMLRSRGFSEKIIERFFRPFLGGVFLDRELATSSRMCDFVFRMFGTGNATIPRFGMGEITKQLSAALPPDAVRTNCPVASVNGNVVRLSSGEELRGRAVIVATEAPITRQLLNDHHPADGRSVACLYFACDEPPIREPILVLNGDGKGPINNLCVPSQVSPDYAPAGQSLVSVTVLDPQATRSNELDLNSSVRAQLKSWFGNSVEDWRHLMTFMIPYALPSLVPPALSPVAKSVRVGDRLYVCGDHCDTASINGAMASGRRAAEALLQELRQD